ncbi:hypothetical protein TNCV_1738861 [Trichonephila clavipes]|nr:hypothetical protein TNCV_1738861 [Trichonephila clavipes]
MSRVDENMLSIYERQTKKKKKFAEIQGNATWQRRSILETYQSYKESLTLLTESKYDELNGKVSLLEWTKTAPLKINDHSIGKSRKGRPNLSWIDGLEKGLLVLRTVDRRRWNGKGFLRRPRHNLGCRTTEEGSI